MNTSPEVNSGNCRQAYGAFVCFARSQLTEYFTAVLASFIGGRGNRIRFILPSVPHDELSGARCLELRELYRVAQIRIANLSSQSA